MSSKKYEKRCLSEIADITMGQSPKGEYCNNEGKGVPLLNGPTEFGENHPYPTQFTVDVKKWARKGDLLFCVRGSTVGRMNWADQDYAIGRGIAAISPKATNTDRFIKALIEMKLPELLKMATGSTFPNVSKNMLTDITKEVPSHKDIIKSNQLLKGIEDKIQTNNEINENLQSLSQLLFKHWFLDFEFPNEEGLPYKSSGGEMVDSDLGMIPKGWKVKQLKEVEKMGKLIMGQSPSGSSYNQDKIGVPLINGAADIKDGNLAPNKYTTEPKKITKVNDLIFCIRATIGLLTVVDGEYCLGRGVAAITDIEEDYYEYIYQIIDNSFEKFKKTASGSVYINLSKDDFNNMKLIVPGNETLEKYHCVCAPILKLIITNKKQIKELSNLRDTLLPKLMNGQINLENIEI